MNGLIITFHILICFFIIFAILLQVGRGAELGAAFGSMGQASNQRGRASLMSKITSVMAMLFMLTSFLLTYNTSLMQKSSVLTDVELTSEEAPAAAPMGEMETTPAPMGEMEKTSAPMEATKTPAEMNEEQAPAQVADRDEEKREGHGKDKKKHDKD